MENICDSKIIGKLTRHESFDDWWTSNEIDIPFFDSKPLIIIYMNYIPSEDPEFLEEADESVRRFLNLTVKDKEVISDLVYKNCTEFLEEIGYDEQDDALWNIKEPVEIWNYVEPQEIYVSRRHRRDKSIYITIACECDWEQEHGLQLVFKEGNKLVRVSEQDGHVTESDAYDKPDDDDILLEF